MDEKNNVKTVSYKLVADFWDNTRIIGRGEIVDFPEGNAPKGSIPLTKSEAKAARGTVVEAAMDPMQKELDELRAKVDVLSGKPSSVK